MSEDQFTSLYKLIEKESEAIRADLHNEVDGVREQINQLYIMMDGFVKQQEAHRIEHAALDHKSNRHEAWIMQLATKTKTKLAS